MDENLFKGFLSKNGQQNLWPLMGTVQCIHKYGTPNFANLYNCTIFNLILKSRYSLVLGMQKLKYLFFNYNF